MNNNFDYIVKNIFQVDSIEDVSLKQLSELADTYPSFNFAHYMLTKKMKMKSIPDFEKEAQKTALYFSNQYWFRWLVDQNDEDPNAVEYVLRSNPTPDNHLQPNQLAGSKAATKVIPVVRKKPLANKKQEDALSFGPYYTIDYFASQGIKVSQEENPKDKFGKQLKSFTEWLKTMKRLPQQEDESEFEGDSAQNALIENFATHSLEQKEVITETMAEVLVKQGKKGRAVELYNKLSLLNPSKSAYFTARIEQLK